MAYITKDDVKLFLGITTTDSDPLLDVLAVRAQKTLDTLCSRVFEQTSLTEKFIGEDQVKFYAPNLPLVFGATEKIEIEDEDDILEADAYVFDDSGIIQLKTRTLTDGKLCTVTYKGGYAIVPEDVKQAAIEICALMFNRNKSTGIKSESDGPVSVTYENVNYAKIPSVQLVVESYRIPNLD